MSSNSHLDSSSSLQFKAIFNAALNEYSQKTGKDIVTDPLTAKLQCCASPDAVLNILQEEAQAFNDFRNGNRKGQLMRKLKPTVDILLALATNGALGNEIGSVSAQIFEICSVGVFIFSSCSYFRLQMRSWLALAFYSEYVFAFYFLARA
jgi:hypothetical protein